MQIWIILAISVHALAAVFWMATTGALARSGGLGAEALFPRQMIAIAIVVLTGGYLWSALHTGGFGAYEEVLAGGAALAVIAALIQAIGVGVSMGRLKTAREAALKRITLCHRLAGPLLALCLVCMVVARFV